MIPVSLKLSNFTSYGENVAGLNFTKFHLAAISGPNGAGKSSLLDAITWCLWGTSRAGDSSDQLIHLGSTDMWVEFAFELDNYVFTVKRRRFLKSGGSTALELWSGSNNLTEGTIKTTQQKIIDLLHLTFETFTNSSYLRQGHADEFTTKGPTDRKRILADILGLSHYDNLEEKAKEKVKEAQVKLKLLEYQLLEIETELSQKDEREKELQKVKQKVSHFEENIKTLERQLKILQKEKEVLQLAYEERQKLDHNLKSQQDELEQILNQGRQRADRIKTLSESLKNLPEIEKKLVNLKSLQQEVEKLMAIQQKKLEIEKIISQLQGELNLKNQQKQTLEKELIQYENQLKNLEKSGAKCPTCGQSVGEDQKHHVKQEVNKKMGEVKKQLLEIFIKDEQTQLKKMSVQLQSLIFDQQEFDDIKKKLQNLEQLQSQKEKALQNQAALETEQKTVEELRALYKNKNLQVKQLSTQLNKLPKIDTDLNQLLIKIEQKEKELEDLRAGEKEARSLLGQATELISRAEQLEKLYKQKIEEKLVLQKESDIYAELALAFGKKGIQAMIIENAIPEIEDEANKLLDKLTEGRMKISLLTQRETKTKLVDGEKGIIETLDIIISDEMGERPYENYSGGEQFRVNFAIRIALSKLLTRRAGAKLQFLVIDEGFGTQDAQGRSRIVEVLDTIKDDFEKILIITHLEELKEEFPVRIEVSKNSGGSTFEVIGA